MADKFSFDSNRGQINIAKDSSIMHVEQNEIKSDSYINKKIDNNTAMASVFNPGGKIGDGNNINIG